MIKEALQWVAGLKDERPVTVEVEGNTYAVRSDRTLGDVVPKPAPIAQPTLRLVTLTGFVAAVKAGIDSFPSKVAVHVIDPVTVALVALEADEHGRRHEWLRATCNETNPFPFGQYQQPEQFLINLQSGFLPTDNVISLQRVASSLTTENSIGVQDDGLSQVITVKQGTVTREAVNLPARIELYAFRTFREIDPVGSDFMLRLKGKPGELPSIALLEVDAGKWKLTAMEIVSNWLSARLPETTVIA